MMDESAQEKFDEKAWLKFKREVLDDPKKSQEWADRVIDSWIRRRSRQSMTPSIRSKKGS